MKRVQAVETVMAVIDADAHVIENEATYFMLELAASPQLVQTRPGDPKRRLLAHRRQAFP
jgi:hypothetical protein